MRFVQLFTFFILAHLVSGQEQYPQDYFRSPLDIPLVLSGTFGELRSNHFHSGIDLKTQRRQGLPIYAIGNATVSRIKVSLWGYGKALYLAHPNGYTSVYAHLKKFSPEIEAYIKKKQYEKKSYEIEVYPDYGELTVEKSDIIAYSGNTGGSFGPHLHFEIRKSVSEKPTNPLLYGYEVRDATNPSLVGLFGYPLSSDAHINKSAKKIQLNFTKQADGSFLADEVSALGTIGFGFNGFDRQDMAANKNGVYSVTQTVNGKVYSAYDFETFSFAETRYINTLIDYEHYGKFRQRIQKCFKEDANKLGIYKQLYQNGKIVVEEGLDYNVELQIADVAGNSINVTIPVRGKKESIVNSDDKNDDDELVLAKKPQSFDLGAAKVYFPESTFYRDFYIDLEEGTDTVKIHDNTVAAHRNFTIRFDASKVMGEHQKNAFIARIDDDDKLRYSKTFKRNGAFLTRTRNFGKYIIARDTVAPKIKPKNFKEGQWLNNYTYISLRISDDLSGIDTYKGTLNGEWILMEYEPKTSTLTYNFDQKIADKEKCLLKVVVTDNVGNTTTLEQTFFKK